MQPCPECGADAWELDAVHDEWTCQVCGLVVDAHLMQPAVPPAPERVSVGKRRLSIVERRTLHVSGSQQRLLDAIAEVKRVADAVGCPVDVADRAGQVLRKARKAGITQGRDLDAMAAAALLASCRMLFLTRPPKAFAEASRADEDAIQNAYKALVSGLKLPIPAMSAYEYLAQVTSKAELPQRLLAPAQERLSCVCGTSRAAGKSPVGWAAAALVLAARAEGVKVSVHAVAKAVGVSDSTVAARIADLEEAACAP